MHIIDINYNWKSNSNIYSNEKLNLRIVKFIKRSIRDLFILYDFHEILRFVRADDKILLAVHRNRLGTVDVAHNGAQETSAAFVVRLYAVVGFVGDEYVVGAVDADAPRFGERAGVARRRTRSVAAQRHQEIAVRRVGGDYVLVGVRDERTTPGVDGDLDGSPEQ